MSISKTRIEIRENPKNEEKIRDFFKALDHFVGQ
jgi:hypothetical protein